MKAKLYVNKKFIIGKIDKRLYSSFIEHLGRAVYGGIYEEEHPTADEMGFRQDVLDVVKELKLPLIRYPGGNFVSGYHWEDGIGDKSKRPSKIDLAWNVIETNQIGIDEFYQWTKKANSEVMHAVNLGTRGVEEACACLEYCNSDNDSYYANLRRKNGFEKPFNIKIWCLGNEMDGPWQIGQKTAEEYGKLASQTGKLMKIIDPNIELVVCGSSYFMMPTFGEWELKVLEETYDVADYISLHNYYSNKENDTENYLCKNEEMDKYIKSVVAICDAIKGKKHSNKTINLSFDEWNIWDGKIEESYTFEDSLVCGCLLTTLQNNCDRVKIACLAQLINALAPIMTVKNGNLWFQTTYYPFYYACRYGQGYALQQQLEIETFSTKDFKNVPYLASSVIYNQDKKEIIIFAINRSLQDSIELEVELDGFENPKIIEHIELYNDDLKICNNEKNVNVRPQKIKNDKKIIFKKHSWNMIRFNY